MWASWPCVFTEGKARLVGRWLCLSGAAIGALGLIDGIMGAPLLTTVLPHDPPMAPNSALGLMLIGVAGALRLREDVGGVAKALSLLAAALVLFIGVATLAEYVLAIDLHMSRLLGLGEVGLYVRRPAAPTALALTCLAVALVLFDFRPTARARPSEWLVLLAALIALTALLGFFFGVSLLYRLVRAPTIGVALPTALGIFLSSVGMLLERSTAGVMRVATSTSPGGTLIRRLVLPIIVAPALLAVGIAHLLGTSGIEEPAMVLAVLSSALTVVALLALIVSAVPLDQAHDALESSRARLREFVEQAPDGIFVANLEGRYIDVNSAGCRMLGYEREELIGKTIVDLIPADRLGQLERERERLLAGRTEVSEWVLRRKDGSYLPVEVSAKILGDGRWQGFVRDISERKHIEERLRLAEAKSSGILSVSADAIISVDDEQRITLFNDGAERVFGYTRAEALGAPLDMLIPERFRAIHRRHVESFAAGETTARRMGGLGAEIFGLRKNGEEFPADAAISKLVVDGTRILTVALRDVTEQKRVEGEQSFLAEVGAVLTSTLELDATLASVGELVTRSLADACIIYVVDAGGEIRRLKAVTRDRAREWICEVLVRAPLEQARLREILSELVANRTVLMERLTPERIMALGQGEEHLRALRALDPKSIIITPLFAHGQLIGGMTLFSSRPERTYTAADVRLAEQVAQRAAFAIENARLYAEARRATKLRDDVLGVVAHDLRNPLNTILLQASSLRRQDEEPERRSRRPAEAIERAATRMNHLIQELLDVARMEGGGLSVELDRVSAHEVLADLVAAEEQLVTAAALELRLEVARRLPELWADRDRLLQVFENLIGNAVKFTEPGGRITVGASRRDGEVLFWVADTGAGIASTDLPYVFDRFWQARKAERGGAGLGLSIARGIVEAHRGRIWVESEVGHGSTFFFTVPAAPREEDTRREPVVQGP